MNPTAESSISARGDATLRWMVAGITLLVAASLLFCQLGHYALWDDEVGLALIAEQVWKTGDTGAVIGHNIVAPHEGFLLKNLHDRSNAPLPAYVIAPFIGLFGHNSFMLRLPCALCGLGCVILILRRL